ncbi:MAG: sugar-binding protein, partial [Clostridia bacterium]|nr:sugar-binding protein [Clostridia bacterium]
GVIGDVNVNGKIDARDYLLLKRAYFGTYTLTCGLEVSDINGNGKIDARDYLLLKRAYFGTYTIQ